MASASPSNRDDEVDPVVELQACVAAEVLDRPLELACVALRAQLVGQLGVDDDDQPLVVGDGRPRAGRRKDLHLVRGQQDAPEGHGAVRPDLEAALAGRGHDGRDRGAKLLPDLRQERLDPPLHQPGFVVDPHDLLDVDLLGNDVQQRVELRVILARQGDPETGQRLAGPQAGPRPERPGQLHRALGDLHPVLEGFVTQAGPARTSASA